MPFKTNGNKRVKGSRFENIAFQIKKTNHIYEKGHRDHRVKTKAEKA